MNPAPTAFSMMPPKWVEDKITPKEYENLPMGLTAERIAARYNISREQCDEFALLSHQRAAKAWKEHVFDSQIVPVEIENKGKKVLIKEDDTVRYDCSMEALAALRPSFMLFG